MPESTLLPEQITTAAARAPGATTLSRGAESLSYVELSAAVDRFAAGLMGLGLQRGERVAISLEKRFEGVVASFGAAAAGAMFVPLNFLLKPEQVAFIMKDCDVRVLATSPECLALLAEVLGHCNALRHAVLADRMELPVAQASDLAVVFQSGTYGASASPQGFLGHPPCIEVLV